MAERDCSAGELLTSSSDGDCESKFAEPGQIYQEPECPGGLASIVIGLALDGLFRGFLFSYPKLTPKTWEIRFRQNCAQICPKLNEHYKNNTANVV